MVHKVLKRSPNCKDREIQTKLKKEFSLLKSETHSIIGFKEIAMIPGETPWDLDQRLKSTIREENMTLTNAQHCAWFMASLTPHLRMPLSQ